MFFNNLYPTLTPTQLSLAVFVRTFTSSPACAEGQDADLPNSGASPQAGSPKKLREVLTDVSLSVTERAATLAAGVQRPQRSAVLVEAIQPDQTASDAAHLARIKWVLETLVWIDPALARVVGSTNFVSLAEANQRLADVSNFAWDVAELLSVIKTYLTWELQITEDFYKIGILPQEVPDVLDRLGRVKERNREMAALMANPKVREDWTPKQWREKLAEKKSQIAACHSPITAVLSLRLTDVPSHVLIKYMLLDMSPLDPKARRAALLSFKSTLVIEARRHPTLESFKLKTLLATVNSA